MSRRVRVVRVIARLNVGGPALRAALLTERLDPARYDSSDVDRLYTELLRAKGRASR